jgi:hypothetical protein
MIYGMISWSDAPPVAEAWRGYTDFPGRKSLRGRVSITRAIIGCKALELNPVTLIQGINTTTDLKMTRVLTVKLNPRKPRLAAYCLQCEESCQDHWSRKVSRVNLNTPVERGHSASYSIHFIQRVPSAQEGISTPQRSAYTTLALTINPSLETEKPN